VLDVIPGRLPDLFEGDQLVVLGQYVGDQPLGFKVGGNYLGRRRTFQFRFDLGKATTSNAFVPRLWASRKIAVLIDGIRALGADVGSKRVYAKSQNPRIKDLVDAVGEVAGMSTRAQEAKLKELVGEVVALSTEFGVLTEYTAFLAREGTDLTTRDALLAEAEKSLRHRAMYERVGLGSVNQDVNRQTQRGQQTLNYRNDYYDQNMNRVVTARVQQVNDRAFFQRGDLWVDSRAVADAKKGLKPDTVVAFGSDEYHKLIERLAGENRQGVLSLSGELLLRLDGRNILVTSAETSTAGVKAAAKAAAEVDASRNHQEATK
jgi:Ca-activated chloride channel family protein